MPVGRSLMRLPILEKVLSLMFWTIELDDDDDEDVL